jgi:hypothetical protein
VALLRASSTALGDAIDLGPALEAGVGVPHGSILLAFATAAHRDLPELADARRAVVAAMGSAALVEACLTVSAFNGLTRVADATGIALDGGTLAATTDVRAALGLNDMAGARSTGAAVFTGGAPQLPGSIRDLFADDTPDQPARGAEQPD